jgi:hypothetical protein
LLLGYSLQNSDTVVWRNYGVVCDVLTVTNLREESLLILLQVEASMQSMMYAVHTKHAHDTTHTCMAEWPSP